MSRVVFEIKRSYSENGEIKLGPFDIEFVSLTHSILEPNGLCIKTPVGTILHTGDWKIDPNPLIGSQIDEQKLLKSKGYLICKNSRIISLKSEYLLSQSIGDSLEDLFS